MSANQPPNPKDTEISTLRAELAAERNDDPYCGECGHLASDHRPQIGGTACGAHRLCRCPGFARRDEVIAVLRAARSEFAQHLIRLVQLHALIDAGKGDSTEAEAERAEMDRPWDALTPEEVAAVRAVGAALNALSRRAESAHRILARWLAWHDDRDNLYDVDEIAAETRTLLALNSPEGEK